ncbi:MAG: hypothetical protein ACK5LX_13940 [Oscillospiraceae bacterium]
MRSLDHLAPCRINNPRMQSLMDDDFIGAYRLSLQGSPLDFLVLVSVHDGEWEHISVSTEARCPIWEEMRLIKEMFFTDDEAAMQLHPPKKDYVNNHPHCLHLWRPVNQPIPMPDIDMV